MLDQLNANEQRVLMELLIYLAKSDGAIQDVEEDILYQYADLVDVDFSGLTGDYTPEILVPQFESATSRVIALQELLRLSHIDGVFADGEKSAIIDVAAYMGVPLELLNKVDRWVVDGLRWVMRGEELLEEAEEDII
jgi:hypothetical protein